MAELEKVQLLNFDIDQYLKDGDATVAACAQAKAVADEIHEQGYENIFLLGIGGTYDELDMVRYFMKKYSEVEVHLVNAAELNVMGDNRLKKDSVVVTASASGDTKEIVKAVENITAQGIRVVAFTREDTPLGKLATTVISAPVATGRCDFTYLLFQAFALRLLNLRGDFDRYDDYMAQTKNLFQDLEAVRRGALHDLHRVRCPVGRERSVLHVRSRGDAVDPHPCRHVRRVLPRHPRARRARRARDHHQG